MTLLLHERYTEAEGPIEEYKRATGDWTPAMQQEYAAACAVADRVGRAVARVEYRCPKCHQSATGIQWDSVSFFETADRAHVGRVVGEGLLIRIQDCGHSFRRPVSASR